MTTQDPSSKTVLEALNVFSGQPDKLAISQANRWLQDFQHTPDAWATCNLLLLSDDSPLAAKTFAAQTFRTKVTYDLSQVPSANIDALKQSLITAFEKYAAGPRTVLLQVCLALSSLALQAENWTDPVGSMVGAYGQSPQVVPALLEFLTVLPDEVTNSKANMKNDVFRHRAEQLLTNNVNRMLDLLNMYIQAPGITAAIQAQIFHCVRSWVDAGEVDISELATTPLFLFAFQALSSDELFDAAVDLICDIIHETQEVDDNMAVIELIVKQLLILRPVIAASKDDAEQVRGYCRIFTEAGETYRTLVLAHPETFFPIVEAIAECAAYPDLDVVQITFNFWYRLASGLGGKPIPDQFRNLFIGLTDVLISHLHFPPDSAGQTKQEIDDFRAFRHIMGDTLKDCCFVLGSKACLRTAYDKIIAVLSRGSGSWQDVEAPLFSMRSMGAEADPDDNEIMPLIMDMIPKLPPHPHVRYAATLVISRYTEWIDKHPQYIEYTLSYVSAGFDDPQVSAAAGQAMKYLCKDCRQHFVSYLPQLHSFTQTAAKKLSQDDRVQIYEAIGYVISTLSPEAATDALRKFCLEILNDVHTIVSKPSRSKEDLQAVADGMEHIEVMLHVISRDMPPNAFSSCNNTISEAWSVIELAIQQVGSSYTQSERICHTLRIALQVFGATSKPIVPNFLNRLAVSFESTGFSNYIWIIGKTMNAFGDEEDQEIRSAFRITFERVCAQVFAILKVQTPADVPDVMEDFLHYLISMISYAPDLLFMSPSFPDAFRVAVSALAMYQNDIIYTSLEFLQSTLMHDCLTDAPNPPPNFPMYAAALKATVTEQGLGLVSALLAGVLTNGWEESVKPVGVLLNRIALAFPQEMITWFSAALQQVPNESLPETAKVVAQNAASSAIPARAPGAMKGIVQDLHRASQRMRDRKNISSRSVMDD